MLPADLLSGPPPPTQSSPSSSAYVKLFAGQDTRKEVINGLSAAIGPPAWPLAIAASACSCAASTRSSTMSPTLQLPSPIAPGATPARAKQRPSSDTSPKRPRSTRKANAKTHSPFVGGAVRLDERQGQ